MGAAVAGAGSMLAAIATLAPIALAGIVLAGAGCSVCAPTHVSLAGRAAGEHERATVVGSLTTLMYLGFLVGPAAVGGVAELTTLRASLGVVAALAPVLAFLFAVVRLPAARSSRWGWRRCGRLSSRFCSLWARASLRDTCGLATNRVELAHPREFTR
jgi:MFS family permease